MAGDDDFHARDRPENPDLEEDRPRGGGPERGPGSTRALRSTWIFYIVAAVVIVVLFLIFL
ncbi:hypothetical protein [Streptomyces sp. NPDC001292]|uniref:hypothetical protein n=1 Tax=Streptomyces sp. NPDC001292 TaxID=3364558 RepID=UPI0036A2E274